MPASGGSAGLWRRDESSSQFRAALDRGESIDEAYRRFGVGALTGMAEGLPLAELLQKADEASGGAIRALLRDAIAEGTDAAVKEAIQQAGEVIIAEKLADPKDIAAAFVGNAITELSFSLLGAN